MIVSSNKIPLPSLQLYFILSTVIKQSSENNNELIQEVKKLKERNNQSLIQNTQNIQNQNIQNNTQNISINVFLNEHCKNAMNLTDFVENIKVSLEDLEYTNQHGYAKGISNIFTKNLTDMAVTERPIHCSDKKRLQFYIKESDEWKKDEKHENIDITIDEISRKQFFHIKIKGLRL